RAAGKETVVYTPYLDVAHYFAATAADRIVTPPGAQFNVLGLRTEVQFLKDALAQIGIQADFIAISPYKTAGNQFSQAEFTPEHREQLEWLLDEQFDMLVQGMANGRHKTAEEMQTLINQAPFFAEDAKQHGLVDHVGYEDELPLLLAVHEESETEGSDTPPQANLQSWEKAMPHLMEKVRRHTRQFIGVVSLEGAIVMGPSRQPPVDLPLPFVGGDTAGEQTLLRLLRKAEAMDNMAALIFHVDSGGGSALASDLIGRQIQRIARKKPVLVYMGNVAASGGYYVSAYGRHIMSQSGTITGSIGVIMGRVSMKGLYERLHINQAHLDRGEHIGLYRNTTPMTDEERQLFRNDIVEIYSQFKQVVANGRNLPYDDLDPICEGRVWTGRQALAHKLVDSHGDFIDAIEQAAAMAELPTDDQHTIPVVNLYPKNDDHVLPQPFPADTLTGLAQWALGEPWREWQGQPMLLLPFTIRVR
ncbi:MAG: signal peptide peptidase SppA, partial [Anaerolineales bacterium]|nr:signal peptide peptidase SppA [Anaerolineales bacterium]